METLLILLFGLAFTIIGMGEDHRELKPACYVAAGLCYWYCLIAIFVGG